MTKLLEGPRKEAQTRGIQALLGWAGTGAAVGLFGLGLGSIVGGAFFGLAGGALSAWLTWRWLKFRGQWGLRF